HGHSDRRSPGWRVLGAPEITPGIRSRDADRGGAPVVSPGPHLAGEGRRDRRPDAGGPPRRPVPGRDPGVPGHPRGAQGRTRTVATPVRRIVNASPPILPAKAGQLEFLRAGVPEILVPDAVLREVSARGPDDPVLQEVQQAAWLKLVPAPPTPPEVLV